MDNTVVYLTRYRGFFTMIVSSKYSAELTEKKLRDYRAAVHTGGDPIRINALEIVWKEFHQSN